MPIEDWAHHMAAYRACHQLLYARVGTGSLVSKALILSSDWWSAQLLDSTPVIPPHHISTMSAVGASPSAPKATSRAARRARLCFLLSGC